MLEAADFETFLSLLLNVSRVLDSRASRESRNTFMTKPVESSGRGRHSKEVRCTKCGTTNPGAYNSCGQCGARLYIVCHECGYSNERGSHRCEHCSQRLHRSWWKRVRVLVFGARPKITLWQLVLLAVSVYVGYKLIVYLAEYRAPPPDGTSLRVERHDG